MSVCPTCDIERIYTGKRTPSRALCNCETKKKCHYCGGAAIGIEFNSSIKTEEPKLTEKNAQYFCKEDAPAGFVITKKSRSPKKKESDGPEYIYILCSACGYKHKPSDRAYTKPLEYVPPKGRRPMVGQKTFCPKCNDTVSVPIWIEDEK